MNFVCFRLQLLTTKYDGGIVYETLRNSICHPCVSSESELVKVWQHNDKERVSQKMAYPRKCLAHKSKTAVAATVRVTMLISYLLQLSQPAGDESHREATPQAVPMFGCLQSLSRGS